MILECGIIMQAAIINDAFEISPGTVNEKPFSTLDLLIFIFSFTDISNFKYLSIFSVWSRVFLLYAMLEYLLDPRLASIKDDLTCALFVSIL